MIMHPCCLTPMDNQKITGSSKSEVSQFLCGFYALLDYSDPNSFELRYFFLNKRFLGTILT